jgi:ferredoxin-NADP reductase
MKTTELDLKLRVENKVPAAEGITCLSLVDIEGRPLPAWTPGAHIDVNLGNGLVRQYSLCGDVKDSRQWKICVLREPASRGGSQWICDSLEVGDVLDVRGPRNNFELVPAVEYVFIAGGIGITPLLPMIERAESRAISWSLTYGGRSLASMAQADTLQQKYGSKVVLWPQDEKGHIDLAGIVQSLGKDSLVYCCGPGPLLNALDDTRQEAGIPGHRVHTERFAPKQLDTAQLLSTFEVEFASSGITAKVGPEQTILGVAQEAGLPVLFSCAEGTCGTCETDIVSGIADHRDSVLTEEEQQAGETLMICVSRAACPKITLDL